MCALSPWAAEELPCTRPPCRGPQSNPWNLLVSPYVAEGTFQCDGTKDLKIGRLFWIIQMARGYPEGPYKMEDEGRRFRKGDERQSVLESD